MDQTRAADSEPISEPEHPDTEHLLPEPDTERTPPPQSKIIYILFFMLGLAQLLPLNFLMNATDFWMYKFRDVYATKPAAAGQKTDLQKYFESYLVMASVSPFLLVYLIGLSSRYQRISDHLKNCVSFSFAIVVFVLITCTALVNTDPYQKSYLAALLSLIFVLNTATVMIQATFTGVVSMFPARGMHVMVTGQAVSGIFAALVQIFFLASPWSLVYAAFAFFLLADLVLLATFLLYLHVRRLPTYKFYLTTGTDSEMPPQPAITGGERTSILILRQIWPFCLTIILTFWVSLACFPSLMVLIVPSNVPKMIPDKFIRAIGCFLLFNLFDFIGRYTGQYMLLSPARRHRFTLVAMAAGRLLFIPIFLLCNAQPRRHHFPVMVTSHFVFMSINAVFGYTHGYLVINAFGAGPTVVPELHRASAGNYLVFSLGIGLTLGALSSPLVIGAL